MSDCECNSIRGFVIGRSYLRARWARAQGLALRGASRLDGLPLNKKEGEKKIEKKVENQYKKLRKEEEKKERKNIKTER